MVRLLDEVDYIASVSGGSFPAMHYGLFRETSFETFPAEFLKRDIEAYHLRDVPAAVELGVAGQSFGGNE